LKENSVSNNVSDEAEFDQYASFYDAGMHHSVKLTLGETAEAFIDVKVRWLKRALTKHRKYRQNNDELKLLDFGCGDGIFLERLHRLGVSCKSYGCDVSSAMVMRARERVAITGAELSLLRSGRVDSASNFFDVVIVSSVLHHVIPRERSNVYEELNRVLAPGGICVIFEHNPFHPAVRYVVATTPIDKNAQLLRPLSVRRGLSASGFVSLKTRWLMSFPPRWVWAHRLEQLLEFLPTGGQYVVTGEKMVTQHV
jgi:2-polyprenyl-3-methyl-5-hydroxy-6-metoxy-1,4-benzoquinol methylase